jgi:acetoin utilization deacetylase AcuC-like enzyme
MILWELAGRDVHESGELAGKTRIDFITPPAPTLKNLKDTAYNKVHSERLLDFLSTGWNQWDALGEEGQDPLTTLKRNKNEEPREKRITPPLIPGNVPLHRDPHQRPSQNVMGQVGYYCTDTCTPIFEELLEELLWDLETVTMAVNMALEKKRKNDASSPSNNVVYALCTHPGHHAARDSFGGYCYVNHAVLAAKLLQDGLTIGTGKPKVAILDVDYHCGNGSAGMYYEDPSVLVVSIHCHPDHDYPFHSGFEDETGVDEGVGATLHIPLLPGTTWENAYQGALHRAMEKILQFGAQGLVLSLGLDTYKGDPCAIRRAGFLLEGDDYQKMGELIGSRLCGGNDKRIPVVVIQEGGYRMDKVPNAATDILLGIVESKLSSMT